MEGKRFLNRITFILLVVVLWAGWQAWSPRALGQYAGYQDAGMSAEEAEEYLQTVKQSLLLGNTVRLKENGVNKFLKGRVKAEQSYLVKPWVEVTGVFLDFQENEYSMCLEREIYGYAQHTEVTHVLSSAEVSVARLRTSAEPVSGMIGKLKLPVKLVYNLSPWIDGFTESLEPMFSELRPLVGRIEIGEGELVLHPVKRK